MAVQLITQEPISRKYEVSLVVSPDLKEAAREKLIKEIGDQIRAWDGDVDKTEEAGKKLLAYQINKFSEAWYYFLDVTMLVENVHDLDMKLKLEDDIIRYLIVKKDE